jgi:Heterokaryon incompatibility protein (HET)
MSQMPNSYEYKPLSGPKCIRILELWPARPKSASLRGRLVDVDIALESQNRPRYDCLSYVWGYDAGDRPINLEGQEVLVTQNCEAALRQLRNKSRSIRIWIDALCINQQNISERNQQVRMMEEIYRKAKHVRIWLNAPESGTWRLIGFRLSLKTNLLVYKLTGNPNGHGSENTAVIGQLFMAHFLPIVLSMITSVLLRQRMN